MTNIVDIADRISIGQSDRLLTQARAFHDRLAEGSVEAGIAGLVSQALNIQPHTRPSDAVERARRALAAAATNGTLNRVRDATAALEDALLAHQVAVAYTAVLATLDAAYGDDNEEGVAELVARAASIRIDGQRMDTPERAKVLIAFAAATRLALLVWNGDARPWGLDASTWSEGTTYAPAGRLFEKLRCGFDHALAAAASLSLDLDHKLPLDRVTDLTLRYAENGVPYAESKRPGARSTVNDAGEPSCDA